MHCLGGWERRKQVGDNLNIKKGMIESAFILCQQPGKKCVLVLYFLNQPWCALIGVKYVLQNYP